MSRSVSHHCTMICSSTANMTDHEANLVNLFNVAQKEGLVFNSAKCAIKWDSVTFFGGVFSAQGYSPDPEKIKASQI